LADAELLEETSVDQGPSRDLIIDDKTIGDHDADAGVA
jgi:hypothetical protein